MSLYKQFKTDTKAEKQGIILEYGSASNGETIQIKIARAGGANSDYQKRLTALMKPYRRQVQNDTLSEEVAKDILINVVASTIILGWQNVEDENGDELPFTKDNAVKLLTDLPDLFADISDAAGSAALFRQSDMDEDLKN